MPKKGFVGKIEIEPDDTKQDEIDGDSSHDMINVEDDDDIQIPCSQIVHVSPYAKIKNVELNNNDPDVSINTEDEKEHTVKERKLEGKNKDICKKEEQKAETVETNENKGAQSSTEQKGDKEVNDNIHKKENKENEKDINSNSVNNEIVTGSTDKEHHVEGDGCKKENGNGGDDPSKTVDQGVEGQEEENNEDEFDSDGTGEGTGEGTDVDINEEADEERGSQETAEEGTDEGNSLKIGEYIIKLF